MRIRLRTVLLILIALVAVGSAFNALSAVESSPSKSETPTNLAATFSEHECDAQTPGVTAIVDFGNAAKPRVFCASNFSGSGWDLISQHLRVEGTSEYPTGFVCRIEGWPTPAEQDCANTPTYSEGSWVYWVADNTSKGWVMSGTGSSMRKPKCGTSEAWVFSKNSTSDTQNSELPQVKPVIFECSKN